MDRRTSATSERSRVDFINEAFRSEDGQLSVTSSTGQEDTNVKSLRHYTREALPNVDFYRNALTIHEHFNRPTLEELHGTDQHDRKKSIFAIEKRPLYDEVVVSGVKFGWITGVFIRCMLNIWGVMLFLRLSWVVAQAGLGLAILVIMLATSVTVLTTLSMSAICTNGEVKGGGSYYMISRCLGPEFGGSIGLIFSLANAVAVAMYVVGFAETVRDLLKEEFETKIVDGDINDVRIIACCTMLFILGITLIGTSWESKAQMVLLVILLTALVDFFVGSFMEPTKTQMAQGFVGWNGDLMAENLKPDFRGKEGIEGFFFVFAVFFPAATGITAGANISGDLKDPQASIPKGTLLAILVTTTSYLLIAVACAATVYRDASGDESDLVNGTMNLVIANCTGTCKYGSQNNFQIVKTVSAYGPIIYAGTFAATLSSALASLVSAPKIFQALCKDRLFPYIIVFAKPYGKNGEPLRAYVLAFVIAFACCTLGNLNDIAPIISNFFLAAYCLMNFSCFHASFARSPGFRPAFKFYNMWLSLLGAVLCLAVMFVVNWWTALLTFGLVLGLYLYIHQRKPDVNWGSSTQAQLYQDALSSVIKLNQAQEHVKNYRPQILVLTGTPSCRPPLVDFAYNLTKKLSLMICGHVLLEAPAFKYREKISRQGYQWLNKKKLKSFYCVVHDESFSKGVRSIIQVAGLGKLKPNVILMGYKALWWKSPEEDVKQYFKVIHDAFDLNMSLGILRLPNGLDYSAYGDFEELKLEEEKDGAIRNGRSPTGTSDGLHDDSSPEGSPTSSPALQRKADQLESENGGEEEAKQKEEEEKGPYARFMRGISKDVSKDILSSVNQFQTEQKGTIDVWWLYDDGGLTMLIPYILKSRSQWSHCQLRVFSLANKKEELDRDHRNMAALLNKFRIDYSDVIIIPDIVKAPKESSMKEFDEILKKWQTRNDGSTQISENEIFAMKHKTKRHIRLREKILENSMDASLIVMTLPMPRKGTCSAPMYMAWLEMLTRDTPPFLLIRGNQASVLTFYS